MQHMALKQQHKAKYGHADKRYKDGLNTDWDMTYSSKHEMAVFGISDHGCTPPPPSLPKRISSVENQDQTTGMVGV